MSNGYKIKKCFVQINELDEIVILQISTNVLSLVLYLLVKLEWKSHIIQVKTSMAARAI